MAKKPTAPPDLCLAQPRKGIRFFQQDEDEIGELHRRIGPITGMSITDIIRRCVRAGLPIIKRQLQPRRPVDPEAQAVDDSGA